MPPILEAEFSTGDVLRATGMTNPNLQSYAKRGYITGIGAEETDAIVRPRVEGAGKPGKHRRFNIFSVMEIAVAQALIEMGVSAATAFKAPTAFGAAKDFAMGGDGPAVWTDADQVVDPMSRRLPGFPFPKAGTERRDTYLFASSMGTAVFRYGADDGNILDLTPRHLRSARWEGAIVLNVSALFRRVLSDLDRDPTEAIREAYGLAGGEA